MRKSGKIYSFDIVSFSVQEPLFSSAGMIIQSRESEEAVFVGMTKDKEYIFIVDGQVVIERYTYKINLIKKRDNADYKMNWLKQKLLTPELPEIAKPWCYEKE